MTPLLPEDTIRAAAALPKAAALALMKVASKAFAAGGHVRSVIAREGRSDVDLFACDPATAEALRTALAPEADGEPFETEFAWTFNIPGVPPVQVVRAWTFATPEALLEHFDFTVAQACIWWSGDDWQGACGPLFYADLAARRIRLVDGERRRPPIEEGGTLLRLVRYSRKGYIAIPETVADVAASAVASVDGDRAALIESLNGIDPAYWPEWVRR